jgi:hypothetical protein
MAIINKAALKAQFKTGGVAGVQSMFNLIDSVIIKRDDLFFGKWQPGVSYSQGDIVIHGKAFYYCITGEGTNPCGDDQQKADNGPSAETSFCSQEEPSSDKVNWQLMFEVPDEDWVIIRGTDGNPDVLYTKIFGNIGIGTTSPEARVHIHDEKKATDFLFNTENSSIPGFMIRRTGEGALTESVENRKAVFTTDTEGFLFQRSTVTAQDSTETDIPAQPQAMPTPVFVNIAENKTAVSIGHVLPEAGLDVQGLQGARVLLAPLAHNIPEIVCLNKSEGRSQQFLSAGVNANAALLTTNAPEGYYLRSTGQDSNSYLAESGDLQADTIVSIKNDKKVGIGTETPQGELDIQSVGGSLVLNLSSIDNPVLRIINIRPNKTDTNYLALGANNDQAVFMTDSNDGFAFKKGPNDPTDITSGENLMVIKADKKLGVGISPEEYELDIYGSARMFSLYLNTDAYKIKDQKALRNVLSDLMNLKPISFKWRENVTPLVNSSMTQEQIGFLPANVQDYFPELVKKDGDGKTIAYANMVGVLTKAIQEQQSRIDNLEARIKTLEAASRK